MPGWGQEPAWGVFDQDGNPVILADSVFSVEYQNTWRISDYVQEMGAFESYNKVKVPYSAKINFLTAGDISNRSDFLQGLEDAVASLDLFVVVTPEISYDNANLTFFNYRRTSKRGVQLLQVEVWLEEIRLVQQGGLSNTQSPNGTDSQNNGSISPQKTGINGGSNLVQNLSPPSGTSTSTAIANPNIGPAFYTADNLPEVPNTYNLLTGQQQQAVINMGQTNGSTNAAVTPPDNNGNIVVDYSILSSGPLM